MQYKTIVLELIEEQYPALREQLRSRKMLLSAVNRYAADLKAYHDAWITELRQASQPMELGQMASMALELALTDLQAALRSDSPPSDSEAAMLSLDAVMASIRRHTPTA